MVEQSELVPLFSHIWFILNFFLLYKSIDKQTIKATISYATKIIFLRVGNASVVTRRQFLLITRASEEP